MDIKAGQKWSYKTRDCDPNSLLVIGMVENHPKIGEIVHIAVKDITLKAPDEEGRVTTHIGHIPITMDDLKKSLIYLMGDGEKPEGIEDGIATWREANGGVFTFEVSKAVQYIEEVMCGGGAE